MTLDVTFQPFAFPIFARAQRPHPIRAPGSALPFRRIWHASCLITTDPTFSERDSAQETDTGTDQVRREPDRAPEHDRSEEHTSELQSLMRISYAVFCLKKKKNNKQSKKTKKNQR